MTLSPSALRLQRLASKSTMTGGLGWRRTPAKRIRFTQNDRRPIHYYYIAQLQLFWKAFDTGPNPNGLFRNTAKMILSCIYILYILMWFVRNIYIKTAVKRNRHRPSQHLKEKQVLFVPN